MASTQLSKVYIGLGQATGKAASVNIFIEISHEDDVVVNKFPYQ